MEELQFGAEFWTEHLPEIQNTKSNLELRIHLVLSLIIHLAIPFRSVLLFMFSSEIPVVKEKASQFMGFRERAKDDAIQFTPAAVYNLWHTRWPRSRPRLHELIIGPCGDEIALEESNRIIEDTSFQINLSKLTVKGVRELLQPNILVEKFRGAAPFMFSWMHVFAASPNRYRRDKETARKRAGTEDSEDEMDDRGDFDSGSEDESWWKDYKGFSRNPVFAIVVAISMLAFVRNRATNILPLILGLFFKISGTSARVMTMLSNAGICVSGMTVERLKARISEDAIDLAVELIKSGGLFYVIFDNINIFIRKSQQRITNRNDMIHATNAAIISIGDDTTAEDLGAKHALRGKRAQATFEDVMPTREDEVHMKAEFLGIIADMIVRYAPDANKWEGRKQMLEEIAKSIPQDRPLPVEKTDARPFGVFDVDEGSKKGLVKVLESIQERSTLSQEEWSTKVRIVVGDWLTSNNLRAARRDRNDDVNEMERLSYPEENSALWHNALQASHNIMRTHYGHALEDPTSLAAHKGLLHRTWDVLKPNYAASKALIRHSLIARLLHCVMVINGMKTWSELKSWRHDLASVKKISLEIFEQFVTSASAEKAKQGGDDWLAHCSYFIRDAVLFCVFEHAVSHADAGRVIRVFKFWALAFRGTGQHNYARECVEVLVKWKYELPPALRLALEKSWFVNRWGEPSRWIASDLYLEQLNFWVKRVFIAQGNGVTIDYIMSKGSACVEAFRDISHNVAHFFGDPNRARRHKEVKFQEDIRLLVEEMVRKNLHVLHKDGHFVPALPPKAKKAATAKLQPTEPKSAIADAWVMGMQIWQEGKFTDFITSTTYDPALGYPVSSNINNTSESRIDTSIFDNGTVFDQTENPFDFEGHEDLHGDEIMGGCPGVGGLGGGDEFSTGQETE
ncbi:hypothetical protein HWV62_18506 [Athelia sp. TMB]|nr:hypothetical protein HWV62_18506 [Athelia sp. TMB]